MNYRTRVGESKITGSMKTTVSRRRPHGGPDPALPRGRPMTIEESYRVGIDDRSSEGRIAQPNPGVVIAIVATALWFVLAVQQFGRPLMYDDANFALGIKAAAETGLPFGNQGWMSDRGDFSQREQWALWHPPLYIYTICRFRPGCSAGPLRGAAHRSVFLGGLATALPPPTELASERPRGPQRARNPSRAGTAVALTMLSPAGGAGGSSWTSTSPFCCRSRCCSFWLYLRLGGQPRRAWLWLAPVLCAAALGQDDQSAAADRCDRRLASVCAATGCVLRATSPLAIGIWEGAAIFDRHVGRRSAAPLGFPLDMPFL